MYDELVKSLRCCGSENQCKGCPRENEKGKCYDEICIEAADAIEELQGKAKVLEKLADKWCEAVPKWIPVTEQLPDDRRDVQITVFWHDAWRTMYGYYDGAYWHLYAPMRTEVADVYVIGWMEKPTPMPLPQPKEG